MRLFFNNNLSHRLVFILADAYPDSLHIKDMGPEDAADTEVWDYARDHRLVIVTKDRDYRDMSRTRGHPPKVIHITLRNCSTETVAALLPHHLTGLSSFQLNQYPELLTLGG